MQKKTVQARVAGDLYDKISKKAKTHRITVSNLIRNLVEDYFEIHNEVWDLVDDKIREKRKRNSEEILGFQTIMLNTDSECFLCNTVCKKGEEAHIAFFANSSKTVVVCADCKNNKFRAEHNDAA